MSDDQPTSGDKETERASPDPKRKKQLLTAGVAAAGIGSAAIVAALLYAKSTRRTQD
jgi:hypothetical protein